MSGGTSECLLRQSLVVQDYPTGCTTWRAGATKCQQAPLYCGKTAQVPIAFQKAAPPLLRVKEAGSEGSQGGAWVLAKGVPEVLGEHGGRGFGKKNQQKSRSLVNGSSWTMGSCGEKATRKLYGEVFIQF